MRGRYFRRRKQAGLKRTFKVLANATRLRLLHALVKRPGLSVTAPAQTVGMKPQAVSNQLQRLVDKDILSNVRNGNNIHYRIVDPCIMSLLDQGLCLAEDKSAGRPCPVPIVCCAITRQSPSVR